MNSQAVEKKLGLDAGCWIRWPNINLAKVPQSPGVYLFRIAEGSPLERVKGTSDIVYIGSGIIRKRLRAHSRHDMIKWTGTGWAICLIMRARAVDVAWREMPLDQARSEEATILQQYLVDHFELPPANRQKPAIDAYHGACLALNLLTPEGQATLREKLRSRVEQ